MTKAQSLHQFWSSFGIPAYSQETVPDKAVMPYLTYEVMTDSFEGSLQMVASLWWRSYSWTEISEKAEEIAEHIATMHPPTIEVDGGRLWIVKGTPFAQRMSDDDDAIRRIVLSIEAEFFTNF